MTQLTHRQLADNCYFLSTKYTKGSKLYNIYRKMYREELFKSIIKFEWLLKKK
jgi:hypothetical protein